MFSDQWWVYFGLLQSWSKDTIIAGIGVAWSLSVEMAFYVLLPVYALLMAKLLGGRDRDSQARLELRLLVASAVAAIAIRTVVNLISPTSVFGNQLPGTWTWFTGGLVLAVASAWLAHRPLSEQPRAARFLTERPVACWAIAFALLTIAAWFIGLDRDPFAQNPDVQPPGPARPLRGYGVLPRRADGLP